MAYILVMENRSFDLYESLKELLLENIKMSKQKNYAFWYGSLLVSLVMYYLESLPAKDNVIWESSVPIARQILRYLNSLDNREEISNNYFKSFADMWRVGRVTVSFYSGSRDSSFRKKKRR